MDTTVRNAFISMGLFIIIASEASELSPCWQQAHDAYEAHQWQEAIQLYGQTGYQGSAYWYNIGNCSYKLGDYKQALLYWKRALRGASAQEQENIVHNIHFLCLKLGYQSDILVPTFLERWVLRFPLLLFQLLLLFIWYVWLFFLVRGTRQRSFLLYGGILLLLATLLCVGFLLQTSYSLHTYERGVIIKEKVSLFTGPHDQYDTLGQLSLYDEVQINETRLGWYKVARNGRNGWIPSKSVTIL